MKRHRQSVDELLGELSPVETAWQDEHSTSVIVQLRELGSLPTFTTNSLKELLDRDFDVGMTIIRLALDLSKDEFQLQLKLSLGEGGIGITRYRRDGERFLGALSLLGADEMLTSLARTPTTWQDILVERLKSGRGSAIKGQRRGRQLEDFTNHIVMAVFDDIGFDVRCRFVGAGGISDEKADFAIPSKEDPRILIEAKAYGATGSKQTDILGDVARIVDQKRHDTHFLLVTDGPTWRARVNDLRKLVIMQNEGKITRIYTQRMATELEQDLRQLRTDHGL